MPIGIMVSCFFVFIGGLIGTISKNIIPKKLIDKLPKYFGLCSIAMSIGLIVNLSNLAIVILSIIIGAVIGELLNLEGNLILVIKKIISSNKDNQIDLDILTTAVALFCFSGTGIFGALNEGFTGDSTILLTKSILDLFTAIIFATKCGYAISLLAIPEMVILLVCYFSAGIIMPFITPDALANFKACGGIITLAVGLKLLNVVKIEVVNILPALFVVILLSVLL